MRNRRLAEEVGPPTKVDLCLTAMTLRCGSTLVSQVHKKKIIISYLI